MLGLNLRNILVVLLLGWAPTISVSAQDTNMEAVLKEINKRLHNNASKRNAIQAGKERTVLCKSCHGEDGNSKKPDVPNLAGQNAGYLLDQINRFADGRRKDFVMNQLAGNFSNEDKINIAIFYFSMPVNRQHVDWNLANKGETLYNKRCKVCHGDEGLGTRNLARLAGQQAEYVKNVLMDFRNSARHATNVKNTRRKSQVMQRITKDLSDEQIAQVAEYVAQLPDEFE